MRLAFLIAVLACPASAASTPTAADLAIFSAMRAEMDRSIERLRLDSFGPPYFIAYRLSDESSQRLVYALGAQLRGGVERDRTLYVETRFGSPAFDNTDLSYHGRSGPASIDAGVLRHQLWQLTDESYKSAVADYLDKKARKATELDRERLDDFSAEPPSEAFLPQAPEADIDSLRPALEAASARFKRYPFVYGSYAFASLSRSRRYLLTSEGTRIAAPSEHTPLLFVLSAWTRAADGMRLDNRRAWTVREASELPATAALEREVDTLAAELSAARQAPVQAPFSAPAIMDPEFAGVFFHEALGHKLEGQRQRDPNESQVFRDQVGSTILPPFLSVVDDPTLEEFHGQALHGHYTYDDEGVPAQRVTLVERGVLRNFLMSRWPIRGFARSNGHGRADAVHHASGRMGNLMVIPHEPVSPAELKRRLMALCRARGKPYGLRLVGSSGGENPNNRRAAQTLEVRPRLVFRVDAKTGEETPVRGVKMVGTPLVVLSRILSAGDDSKLSNPFNCGAESGSVAVNQIAPSLLLSEVELQRLPEERSRPPLLPSPFHEK